MSMTRAASHVGTVIVGYIIVAGAACSVGEDSKSGGSRPPDDDPVIGASANGETNIISEGWEVASVHAGNNLKMLNFIQMQSEVLRATTITYGEWAENRVVFGAPDFTVSFQEDRTPTATKVLTWRKIAFSVCTDMIKKETATPALFSSIAPTAAIGADDPRVVTQLKAMFTKFFFEPPTPSEVDASIKALVDTVAAGGPPSEAWSGLCVAYLSSTRFLTY